MLGFFDWFVIHNNWVFIVFAFCMWGLLGMIHEDGWKRRVVGFIIIGLLGGGTLGSLVTWDGYRTYKNHYTTCAKPAAVEAFYVFDFPRERCLKPFVGFVPVNATGNVELKAPAKKPAAAKQEPQLVSLVKGADNV